jgi:hypothetical protein
MFTCRQMFIFACDMMKSIIICLFLCFSQCVFAQIPPQKSRGYGSGSGSGLGDFEGAVPDAPPSRGVYTKVFKQDGKYGLKVNDTVVMMPVYDKINYGSYGYFVKKDGRHGMVNNRGKIIVPVDYDTVLYSNGKGDILLVIKHKLIGAFDTKGNKILSTKYSQVLYCNPLSKTALVENKQGEKQVILPGEKVFKKAIDHLVFYRNGLSGSVDGKYGLISGGKVTIPFEYDSLYIHQREERYYRQASAASGKVKKEDYKVNASYVAELLMIRNKRTGLIAIDGTVIYPAEFDKISYDKLRGIYYIQNKEFHGMYFQASKKKLDVVYNSLSADGTQFITVMKDKKYGLVDYQVNWILPIEFDDIRISGIGVTEFKVIKNGKHGIYNSKGEEVIKPVYDDLNSFYESNLKHLYKVKQGGYSGLIDNKMNVVIPLVFDGIYDRGNFFIVEKEKKRGLYDLKGNEIRPATYKWFENGKSGGSSIFYCIGDSLTGAVNAEGKTVLEESYTRVDCILNEQLLLNTYSPYQSVRHRNGKYGIFNEVAGNLVVPAEYDEIMYQAAAEKTLFIVKKAGKYGVINSSNEIQLPFQYDVLRFNDIDMFSGYASVVAAKSGKYGVIDMNGAIAIPFQYTELSCISGNRLFKVRTGKYWSIINRDHQTIHAGPFDEVANFEEGQALTFYQGTMKVIDEQGVFQGESQNMQPHHGYKTFEELKLALIQALDATNDAQIKTFARKIAPSAHILYYLKNNIFTDDELAVDVNNVIQKYESDLLDFKQSWTSGFYNRQSLLSIADYTIYKDGFITNIRYEDHAFGNSNFMEKLLRNAIKINGYWISTYFMKRNFDRER